MRSSSSDQIIEESGLTDARLAPEQQRAALSRYEGRDEPIEDRDFVTAPDELDSRPIDGGGAHLHRQKLYREIRLCWQWGKRRRFSGRA